MTVLVSYSHDSEHHRRLVKLFSDRLREQGIPTRIDQDEPHEPEHGWPHWMMDELERAAIVLIVCTEKYYKRFRKREDPGAGLGVTWEAGIIVGELYVTAGRSSRFIPVLLDEAARQYVPDPLRVRQAYLASSDEGFGALTKELRSRLDAAKAARKLAGTANEEWPDLDLGSLKDLRAAPLMRITVHTAGSENFEVEVEIRCRPMRAFVAETFSVKGAKDLQTLCDEVFRRHQLSEEFAELEAVSREDGLPIRIQLILGGSAYHLQEEDWEDLEWNGRPLADSPTRVFSRQLDNSGAEKGESLIKPRTQISYAGLDLRHTPSQVVAGRRWCANVSPGQSIVQAIGDQWVRDGDTSVPFQRLLKQARVVYFSLPIERTGGQIGLAIPSSRGTKWTTAMEFTENLKELGQDQPSLIILAPFLDDPEGSLTSSLAFHFSLARTPAVVAPIGVTDAEVWDEVATGLVDDLKGHGTIDLAVARARERLRPAGGRILLYLRAKSARLWYEPGLFRVTNPEAGDGVEGVEDSANPWGRLTRVFDSMGTESRPSLVFVGGNFDPELSWSRRDIARRLARQGGFALSKREAEELGTVTEFLQMNLADEGTGRSHIPLFLKETKKYLLNRFAAELAPYAADQFSIQEIVKALAAQRLQPGGLFDRLSRLRARGFVTVYLHDILERALELQGRSSDSYSFRFIEPGEKLPPLSERHSTVEHPLVYHCFGRFKDEDSILLSRSDYLTFFEEFCLRRDPVTKKVRSLMGSSPLLFLGFRATGENLRMLLSIVRGIEGAYMRKETMHIAVQVDPEDDHTIDPEGVRTFYSGLISGLGRDVAVFWGTPDDFFRELEARCPSAFFDPPVGAFS